MAKTAYIWQSGGKSDEWDNGNERRIKDELEEVVRQINTARAAPPKKDQLVKSNALMQAAAEDVTRGMSQKEIEDYTPQECADDHLWDGDEVRAVYAQGSPSVLALCDAIVRDEAAKEVIDSDAAFIGVGLAGSQYNLRLAVYVGKGDPKATRGGKEDQGLTEIALRDGLMFGDDEGPETPIVVWTA